MSAAITYFDQTLSILHRLRETELPNIERAAEICTSSIAQGGLVFLFGNGHSRMMCEEMTPRQGCFPGWVALVELSLSTSKLPVVVTVTAPPLAVIPSPEPCGVLT